MTTPIAPRHIARPASPERRSPHPARSIVPRRAPLTRHLPALCLATILCFNSQAQQLSATPTNIATATAYSEVSRGLHSRLMQRTTTLTNAAGVAITRTNAYKELATGMSVLSNGFYVAASPQIQTTAFGGAATNCQTPVVFAANLNTLSAVDLITPEGWHMTSDIAALAYFDGITNVVIASPRDSIGQVLPSLNEVIYTNAFSGVNASVLYRNRLSGFEQNVVINDGQLPSPTLFGLTGSNIWLQVWTEFTAAPTVSISETQGNGDEFLDFGQMKMGKGRAFLVGTNSPSVPVFKQWFNQGGRTFLIESVLLNEIEPQLEKLRGGGHSSVHFPHQSMLANASPPRTVRQANLPVRSAVQKSQPAMRIAAQIPPMKGLVLDYNLLNGSMSNYVFQSDSTTFITNVVNLYGSTVWEGGAVVKFAPGTDAQINLNGSNIVCKTSRYRSVFLTAKDDDTVGTQIDGSSGTPTNYYGSGLVIGSGSSGAYLDNFRFYYSSCAVTFTPDTYPDYAAPLTLENFQALNCDTFITSEGTAIQLRNGLVCNVNFGLNCADSIYDAENLTVAHCSWFASPNDGGGSYLNMTNCLLVAITNYSENMAYETNHSVFLADDAGVFQTMGAGRFYLADGSTNRSAGTTNIDSFLLAELRQRTTYPPHWLTSLFTSNTVVGPVVARDTNSSPDLGYHYFPIDYLSSCTVSTNVTLTLSNGVAIAYYNQTCVSLLDGAQLNSQGSATNRNYFVHYQLVQEQATNLWSGESDSEAVKNACPLHFYSSTTNYPSATLRFNTFSALAGEYQFFLDEWGSQVGNFSMRDCEIYEVGAVFGVNPLGTYTLQNNLFSYFNGNLNGDLNQLCLTNNTFVGGSNTAVNIKGASVFNNAYDVYAVEYYSTLVAAGNNAFRIGTHFYGGFSHNNDIITNLTWVSGPLGDYYQPTNSPLLNKGNTSAILLDLGGYTVLTNQIPEGTNVVSIGYHYLGTSGSPTVTITTPTGGTFGPAPTNMTVVASASSPNGSIQWVEFFDTPSGGTNHHIGFTAITNGSGNYQINWNPVMGGVHTLTAKVQDSIGSNAVSPGVTITVKNPPSISITSPTNHSFIGPAPTNINVTAIAVPDTGLSITDIQIFVGTNLLGSTTSGTNFTFNWTSVAAGTYALTATATDSRGAGKTSTTVYVTVDSSNAPPFVNAGPDQTIPLSSTAFLVGTVSDDGLPRTNSLVIWWATNSAPPGGFVVFGNTNQAATSATFNTNGVYRLTLSASDGQFTTNSTVTITVDDLTVNAGSNQTFVLPAFPAVTNHFTDVTQVVTNLTGPIGVGYIMPSNSLVMSLYSFTGGEPYDFIMVNPADGTYTQFSSISNWSDEVNIGDIRNTLGGFNIGEFFAGDGRPGEICRVEPDGSQIGTNGPLNAWVVLTNETGYLEGSIMEDQTGVFGYDLIAATTAGGVWRINSGGHATCLTNVDSDLEAVTTVPNDPVKYGPWAGRILAGGDDDPYLIYAIDTNGAWVSYQLNFKSTIENILVIPENENFFGVDNFEGRLWSAPAAEFQGMAGDILLATGWGEAGQIGNGYLYRIRWNGTNFETSFIGTAGNNGSSNAYWDQAIFAPAGVSLPTGASVGVPPTPFVQLSGQVFTNAVLWSNPSNAYWTFVSGPGAVRFDAPTSPATKARFTLPGPYDLRLTASDGLISASSDITVEVVRNQAPTNGVPPNLITTNLSLTLTNVVTDDGWPSNSLTVSWSQLSGPGTASFTPSTVTTNLANFSTTTLASFTTNGTYLLQVTASDGQATATTQIRVTGGAAQLTLTPSYSGPSRTNTSQSLTATLLDSTGNIITNKAVQFAVSGANIVTSNVTTGIDGTAHFSYSGTNFGRDLVQAVTTNAGLVVTSQVAVVDWAIALNCGESTPEVGQSNTLKLDHTGSISRLTPTNDVRYANYFILTGTAGDTLDSELYGIGVAWMMYLSFSNQIVAESAYSSLITTLPYSGDYVLELTTAYTNFEPPGGWYQLTNSCIAGNPEIAVYEGATNVPNGGAIVFPTTTPGTTNTVSVTITNAGNTNLTLDGPQINGGFQIITAPSSSVSAGGSTTMVLGYTATATNSAFGSISLPNNSAIGQYVIYLVGFPSGANPSVQLTNPTNGTVFLAPAPIPLTAVTTNGATNVNHVTFQASSTNGTILIGTITSGGSPYTFLWSNAPAGFYLLTATAVDAIGRAVTSAPVAVSVLSPFQFTRPVANDDVAYVQANSVNNYINVLANDTDPNPNSLRIISFNDSNYTNVLSLANNGKGIYYTPKTNVWGGDWFTYVISDANGLTATGHVTVNIANLVAPAAAIITPTNGQTFSPGALFINVSGSGNSLQGTINSLAFYVNGKLANNFTDKSANATNTFTIPGVAGTNKVHVVATDSFGQQVQSSDVSFTVNTNGSGCLSPTVYFSNVVAQSISGADSFFGGGTPLIRDGLFTLTGGVFPDPAYSSDVMAYQVNIYSWDGSTFIANATAGITNTNNGFSYLVGLLDHGITNVVDLTMLQNGTYMLELVALDTTSALMTRTNTSFILDSNLKIGQFSFSQQDLVIPVNGLPLAVMRTYNSINPNLGDFGYSWSYSILDLQVSLAEYRTNASDVDDNDNSSFSMRTGGSRDVTLTLPNGQRTTFTFYFSPDAPGCESGELPGVCDQAKYQSAPGVTATLEAMNDPVLNNILELAGTSYPPYWNGSFGLPVDNYDFKGFILTMPDNTKYIIKRQDLDVHDLTTDEGLPIEVHAYGQPYLWQIQEPTGDLITITPNGIIHSTAHGVTNQVVFQRQNGLIVAITDPNGLYSDGTTNGSPPAVKYEYDNNQNLRTVSKLIDRTAGTYATSTFTYTNVNFPHYVTSITAADGNIPIRTLYDSQGRMIGTVDAFGHTNSFSPDLGATNETVYDRLGNRTIYYYDTRGNVTATVDPLGHTNGFTYDTNNYLLSQSDGLGNTTQYSNDASGNVLSVTLPYPSGANPANYTTSFTYDQYGNQKSVTLPTGAVITNNYDASTGNLLSTLAGTNIITTMTYNDNGLVASEGDQFGSLSYGYDSAGNATTFTNALGQVTTSAYDANGQLTNMVETNILGEPVTSAFQYDGLGRDTTANYGSGINVSYNYQADQDWNNVSGPSIGSVGRQFDEEGRLAGWTTANGSSPGYAYDSNGRLQFETNSIGVVTAYGYDIAGELIAVTNLATGATTTYAYDAAGRRTAETNAVNAVTQFAYYPDGSLMAMTNATGTNVWLYSDSASSCSACGEAMTNTVTDPFSRIVEEVQNQYGLPIQTIFVSGTNATTNSITYIDGIVSPDQEAQEYPATITDESGRMRSFTYSSSGQLLTATDLGGDTWTNNYDSTNGSLLSVASPTGETTSYTYDGLDNVTVIRYPDGFYRTNSYSAGTNLLSSVVLPSGITVSYAYDSAGRLTNSTSSVDGEVAFQYNGNDQITTMWDASGGTTNLYDSAGRLYGIDYPTGASIRYDLDALGRITNATAKASSSGVAYTTSYRYDLVGNVTNIVDPLGHSTSLEYDAVGRRMQRMLPNGVVTTYAYDWRDRVTNIVHKIGGVTNASIGYVRGLDGEPLKITREDGTYVLLSYDDALRLTNEVYYSSGGSPVATNGYGYDADGNRTLVLTGGVIYTNSVDAGYRVTQVKIGGSVAETYTYDSGGRLMSLSRAGQSLTMGYNTVDQITNVIEGTTTNLYIYDGTGRRVKSLQNGAEERRFVTAQTAGTDLASPYLIADGGNNVQQGYVYMGLEPLLRYDGSGNAVYYLEDGMGSVVGLANASGTTTATFQYDGFGNLRSATGTSISAPTGTGGDFRFQGQWQESASGLYHMRARDYDAWTGRFLSRDPDEGNFKAPETLNPYCFANNSPFIYSDPSGSDTLVEINLTSALQFTLQTLRTVAVNQAKSYGIGKIADAFTADVLQVMSNLIPGFNFNRLKTFLAGNPLAVGNAFDKAVHFAICEMLDTSGLGDKANYNVRVVNHGPRRGDPISAGRNCAGRNTRVLGQTLGASYSIPDFIFGPPPLVPPGGPAGMQMTSFIGEAKIRASTMYQDYFYPGRNKAQLNAILGYGGKHTEEHIALFVILKNDLKRGISNQAKLYIMKRLMLEKALSRGVIPIMVSILPR
jgi:RHS repeat-associated protein